MPPRPFARPAFRCEPLEPRDTPAGFADSFDAAKFPYAPPGWDQQADNGQQYYAVTRSAAVSGNQSLAVYGTVGTDSRLWNSQSAPGDVVVSASVRADAPAPVFVFGRGSALAGRTPTFVSLGLHPGGVVELRETKAGVGKDLIGVRAATPPAGWVKLSLTVVGTTATAQVQRADTGEYLNPAGRWQKDPVNALSQTVSVPSADGFAGVGRLSGPYGTAYVDDFAAAPATDIPRHYSHIRLAQLAYDGTPVGAFEQGQVKNNIDLVVSNPALMPALDQGSPTTPQLIYSNVSNLYGGLLTDWLGHADRTGTPREAAFYHVTGPTPFEGGSPSSQPVTWFWDVERVAADGKSTDLTANARGGRADGVALGGSGDSLEVGYPDRFRELNLSVSKAAANGWTGVWEYAAGDGKGGVVWRQLLPTNLGPLGLAAVGTSRVSFEPPANWTPVSLPGSPAALYYVRFRATAGTAADAPALKTLLGRDYVHAVTVSGRTTGTIPAFDSAADVNGDGYLSDAEWGKRRAGFDARFAYESRLFYPFYGQMRFVTNPNSAAIKAWAADVHTRQLAANPLADGIFLDNANGKLPFAGVAVAEPVADYVNQSAALVGAVTKAVGPKLVFANTAGAATPANPTAAAATGAVEEFLLRPTDATWSQVGDAANIVSSRLAARGLGQPAPYLVIDTHPGSTSITDPRTRMGALSYYYLLADPDKTFLMLWGGYAPAAKWSDKWVPAAAVDVGRPTGTMTTFATGTDPQNPTLAYKVFARTYEKALVLYKPRSYTLGKGTGSTDAATATTHQLGGNYRVLNADGTLGPVVTQLTLRNGEGAVLLKA
jgi:hypothetical protein